MIVESKGVPSEVISRGPLHFVVEGDIYLVSPKITSSSDYVVFEAGHKIYLQEQSVFNQEDFHYFKRKNKIYERESWREERTPLTIAMPGRPVFKAGEEICGELTRIQGCTEPLHEAPQINLMPPRLRHESHDRVIGHVSKGMNGLDIVAMLGTTILLLNPATTWVAVALEVAKDSALAVVGGAILTSVASQTVGSAVAHRGNIKQVGKDLTSKGMGVDLFATLVTGGGSGGSLTFLQQAKKQVMRAGIRAGLNIAILGEKPKHAFKEAVKYAAVNTVAAYTSGKIGQAYRSGYGPLDFVSHKLLHGGVGALTGVLMDLKGDPLKSAASGALGAIVAETVADVLTRQPHEALVEMTREAKAEGRELTRDEYLKAYQDEVHRNMDIGRLCAGIAAVLTRSNASLSVMTATNALENNFITAIRLAATLTPKMLASMGVTGISAYQLGQWLKDQPFARDMLPEGVVWEDQGFMPEEGKGITLTTPGHENKPLILHTPIADPYSWILQTPIYDGPNTSILFKEKGSLERPLSMGEFKSDVFTRKIQWTSSVGTKQTYPVFQRGDIDWNMVRTEVKGAPTQFIGKTNVEAAKAGLAPQLADGSFATIHHIGQNAKGPLVEASRRYHGIGAKNNGQVILHQQYGYGKKHPENPVDHEIWLKEQKEYWKWRAKDHDK
jgi:hypothetical protein